MRPTFAALTALSLLLVSCTGVTAPDAESDPEGALRDAVERLAEYEGIEVVLSATGDAEALAEDPDEVEATQLLLDSRIVVRATSPRDDGDDQEDSQFELQVDLDGTEVFEVRVLPRARVFLRADLEGFADAVDDPALTADLDDLVRSAQQFGFGDVAEVATSGGWVELTGVEQLLEFAEGFAGAPEQEPTEEDAEELQAQLVAALERFVDEDVAVEHIDSDDIGERLRATTSGAALQRLYTEITALSAEASGVDPSLLGPVEEDIPADQTFALDIWLDRGELTQIGLDLTAFDDTGEVPPGTALLIGFAEFTGEIEAPEDAEPFDLFGIISGLLFGGLGDAGFGFDGGAAGGAGALDLDDLDDAPDRDLDLDDLDEADVECVPQSDVEEFGLEDMVDAGLLEVC